MSTETETIPETAHARESRDEGLGGFGLTHLAACGGAAGAAVLAVILIEWLM